MTEIDRQKLLRDAYEGVCISLHCRYHKARIDCDKAAVELLEPLIRNLIIAGEIDAYLHDKPLADLPDWPDVMARINLRYAKEPSNEDS